MVFVVVSGGARGGKGGRRGYVLCGCAYLEDRGCRILGISLGHNPNGLCSRGPSICVQVTAVSIEIWIWEFFGRTITPRFRNLGN